MRPIRKRRIGTDAQRRLARLITELGTTEKLFVTLRSTIHTIENATTIGVRENIAARLETRLRELVPDDDCARERCRSCVHHAHRGMCTGRNGGTAYPCPCFRSS